MRIVYRSFEIHSNAELDRQRQWGLGDGLLEALQTMTAPVLNASQF